MTTHSSEAEAIIVVDWISYDEAERMPESIGGGHGGCFRGGMRWCDLFDQEAGPHATALRQEILRKRLKRGGRWHQTDPHGVPKFSDGTVGLFSYRAWGDFLAAVWSTEEDKDYHYMDFYWGMENGDG